jgi:hypothetical protein
MSDHADAFDDGAARPEIIDEEEMKYIRQLKELKKGYKDHFNAIRDLKSAINFSQQAIDSSKQSMVADFEQWYLDSFEDPMPLTTSKSHQTVSPGKSP